MLALVLAELMFAVSCLQSNNICEDLPKPQCEKLMRVREEIKQDPFGPKLLVKNSTPKLIYAVRPSVMDQGCLESEVQVAFDIANTGSTTALRLESAAKPELAQQAVEAVRLWRFIPAIYNKERVSSTGHLAVFRCIGGEVQLFWKG